MTQEESNPNLINSEDGQSINIRDLLTKYLYHWPVFVLTITLCLTAAFFYLRYAQKIFLVSTTLLVKDEKKGGMPTGDDIFNELNLFGSSKVVENEIEILKSKTLMRKVVDRLNLTISFKENGRIIDSEIYANKPAKIDVVNINERFYGKTFELSILNNNYFLLREQESGKTIKGKLNDFQRNEIGVFKITRNEKFKASPGRKIYIVINDPKSITNNLLGVLTLELASKQSTVLKIGLESPVPKLGEDIVNTLIQVYNEAALLDKNKTTQSTIQFIDERLKLITGELTEVEKGVEDFKSTRGLTDISNDANLFLENVKNNDAKLNEINLQLSIINNIQRYVNSPSSQEKLPSTLGISDPVLLTQITQLGELQLERDQLLATTTINNPLVDPITKKIETTRESVRSAIENITRSLQVSKARLEGNNFEFQGSIKKIPGQERQLISIKRQQTIKESLYLYLLQKKEEAALSFASSVADSRIIDPAYHSKFPIKPKGAFVYLGSLIFGLALPMLYIYLKDMLNNKIKNESDVAKLTSTPLLGEISLNEKPEAIVVNASSRTAIAEQFRSIRTNMQFLHGKKNPGKGRVTLFTSSMSGEGKSFIASNLATALAISGKKTVLLELDLRKPKISKYLGLANHTGISNYLIGHGELEDILQPSGINPNLFVIGSGPIPPNPSELLINEDIEELIENLKDQFDEVLIDTPPIGLVTDAQILSRLTDVTIYVIRQGVTYNDQVSGLDSLYRQHKLPKLNVILNGVALGGNYGYGYGYYTDDISREQLTIRNFLKELRRRF